MKAYQEIYITQNYVCSIAEYPDHLVSPRLYSPLVKT